MGSRRTSIGVDTCRHVVRQHRIEFVKNLKKMLKPRSKSVDLHLGPEDNLLSAYSWKSNLLCGVYKEEMTSSIFYTSHASEDRYVSARDMSENRYASARD